MLSLLLIGSMAFAQTPNDYRLKIIQSTVIEKAQRESGLSERFVSAPLTVNLISLAVNGSTGQLPWSGYFWPNFRGGIAYRFTDPSFPKNDWSEALRYVESLSWDRVPVEQLSAAEKYDLLMGIDPKDKNSLTSQQWNLARNEYTTTGTVATWQGICHGWSPASVFLPTPKKEVVLTNSQRSVRFSVEDIKALGSLYYANGQFNTSYAGWRCNDNNPATDADGRITDAKCFDVNPADWHLILTNLIGLQKRPFLMDAQNSEQVWNKAVTAYRVEFFDVASYSKKSFDFKTVLRQRARLNRLRFGTYRAPETVWVVGVNSVVTVGEGHNPGVSYSSTKEITYSYDLELDQEFNVIGGEWRSEDHPDFLWRPEFDSAPTSLGDQIRVDTRTIGDKNWQRAALKSNSQGAPLKAFIELVFEGSNH
ncbi:MAG: hypothetical protein K2P81_03260 [Bacteriovoracaceae bacterium]|nr:hypothetical protein [Bacteriovoracaceae bacterium]